jgi:hypothetical protein
VADRGNHKPIAFSEKYDAPVTYPESRTRAPLKLFYVALSCARIVLQLCINSSSHVGGKLQSLARCARREENFEHVVI